MTSRARKIFALASIFLLGLPLIVVFFVDVEDFRGLIENRLQKTLGREVRLGEMQLSLRPIGVRLDDVAVAASEEEGGGDLLTAESLRVGARLGPLLSGRLEMTSIVIERPSIRLQRDADGVWNVERLFSEGDEDGAASGGSPTIELLSVVDGRAEVLDLALAEPLEAKLDEIAVELRGFGTPSLDFKVQSRIDESARLVLEGALGAEDHQSLLTLAGVAPALIEKVAAATGSPLDDGVRELLGDRPWTMTTKLSGRETIAISDLVFTGGTPRIAALGAVLEKVRVEMDRLPVDESASLTAIASLRGAEAAKVRIEGRIDPAVNGTTPIDLDLDLSAWPATSFGEAVESGVASGKIAVKGPAPGRLDVRGAADLRKIRLQETEALDLDLEFDLVVLGGGEKIEVRSVDADLGDGGKLAGLRGMIEQQGDAVRVDLTLPPNQIDAEGLLALSALAGAEPSVRLEAEQPLEAEARIVGRASETQTPSVSGRLRATGLLADVGLQEPLREIDAEIVFADDGLRSENFRGRFGTTDLRGSLRVDLESPPVLSVDLQSDRADFTELLRLSESRAESRAENSAAAKEDEEAGAFRASGRLRVASGSWDTLDFSDLDAQFQLADGALNFEPVVMKLYEGEFTGRLGTRLDVVPATFDLDGLVESLDLDAFLADNLDAGGRLRGRFTGELKTSGASDEDPSMLLRSLLGSGRAEIVEGGIPGLDLLTTISRISGVLGEQSIAALTDELARDGTRFDRLDAGFELRDGGMALGGVRFVAPLFALDGIGEVDLLAGRLDLQAELAFGEKISNWMRAEESRAAELFWDEDRGGVVLPLTLDGSLDSPRGTVDWGKAIKTAGRRAAEKKLLDLLGDALGRSSDSSDSAADDSEPDQQR